MVQFRSRHNARQALGRQGLSLFGSLLFPNEHQHLRRILPVSHTTSPLLESLASALSLKRAAEWKVSAVDVIRLPSHLSTDSEALQGVERFRHGFSSFNFLTASHVCCKTRHTRLIHGITDHGQNSGHSASLECWPRIGASGKVNGEPDHQVEAPRGQSTCQMASCKVLRFHLRFQGRGRPWVGEALRSGLWSTHVAALAGSGIPQQEHLDTNPEPIMSVLRRSLERHRDVISTEQRETRPGHGRF